MWKVYYDDGTTRDDSQGFDGLEPYGVICILQEVTDPGGKIISICYGAPYYVFMDGEWVHMQINDIEDRLAHRLPIGAFLIGRAVSKATFTRAFDRAKADKAALP